MAVVRCLYSSVFALSAYDFQSNRIQKSGGFCLITLEPFRCNGQACTGFRAPLKVITFPQKIDVTQLAS